MNKQKNNLSVKKLFKFCNLLITAIKMSVNMLSILAFVYVHCFLSLALAFCLVCAHT